MTYMRLAPAALLALGLVSCKPRNYNAADTKDAWNAANDPSRFGANMKRTYSTLPKQAKIKEPWSDTYWPSSEGGVAARWLQPGASAWTYKLYSASELKSMSADQIKVLSPAEKLDIYAGRYDYPTVKAERSRVQPDDQGWEGLCHAWTPASLAFDEPGPVTLKNRDGVTIPFGASDIKALLIIALHHNMNSVRHLFAGTRCENDAAVTGTGSQTPCKDINAGSFHVILTNMLGLNKTGFTIDVTRESQVWNQPVFAYTITEGNRRQGKSAGAAPNTASEVDISAEVQYGLEISPEWESAIKSGRNNTTRVVYNYRLELDASGEIVGGEWLNDKRPDFAWAYANQINLSSFSGPGGISYALVKEIWQKSIGGTTGGGVQPPVYPTPQPEGSSCTGMSRGTCFNAWPACRWMPAVPGITEGECIAR